MGNILFFSSDDWDSGLKTSKYHMSTRLARDNKVLFVNSLGLRRPNVSSKDIKRVLAKISKFRKGIQHISENLYVISPLLLPFHGNRLVEKINRTLVSIQIRMAMDLLKMDFYDIWTFHPITATLLDSFRSRMLIYYCVDRMDCFVGVPSDKIRHYDKILTKKADLVFCVSKAILHEKLLLGGNAKYTPHGVDHALYSGSLKFTDLPEDIAEIPKPIIGFWGLISRDWIDYDLVAKLAQKYPKVSLVFLGRIDDSLDSIPNFRNIHYLGPKAYHDLPRYGRGFDVAIIPFVKTPLTRHSNPLKALEYIASGIPVVTVDIPELSRLSEKIQIAKNGDDFIRMCGEALSMKSDDYSIRLSKSVLEEDWDSVYMKLIAEIERTYKEKQVLHVL